MKTHKGFSLVELMVALTIGLLLMAAMVTLYLNISRTNQEMAKTNSQIENGRFAIQILENDLAHAAFLGGYVPAFDDLTSTAAPGDIPSAIPAPCDNWPSTPTLQYKYNLLGIPVQLYDSIPTGCSTLIANRQSNTDILLVRHVANCVAGATNCEPDTAGNLYFQYSNCSSDTNKFILDSDAAQFTLKNRNCTTTASKWKFSSNIYFIRNYSVSAGDGIPTLMRSSFGLGGSPSTLGPQVADALISGIQGFNIELGIDTVSDDGTNITTGVSGSNPADSTLLYTAAIKWANSSNLTSPRNRGDGLPDNYVRPPLSLAQLTNVVTAKVYVLARADRPTPGYTDSKTYRLGTTTLGPFNDNYKRHVFMTTVRINNVSGRRETPP
jgi:type IV pilus assembly protein PilW